MEWMKSFYEDKYQIFLKVIFKGFLQQKIKISSLSKDQKISSLPLYVHNCEKENHVQKCDKWGLYFKHISTL
jgi:hypothetical protein